MSPQNYSKKLSIYFKIILRKIKSSIKRWRMILSGISVLALVGFAAGILDISSYIATGLNSLYQNPAHNTVLVKSRIVPLISKVDDPRQQNQAFLQIQLRNIDTDPILLTGAKIIIKNSQKARIGVASSDGKCSLSSNIGIDSPVLVDPGKAKWLNISPAIQLPGIEDWLKKINYSQAMSSLVFVDSLNQYMRESYGKNAYIQLKLFRSPDDILRSIKFHLSDGGTPFTNGAKLNYFSYINSFLKESMDLLFIANNNCGESEIF